MKFNRDAYNFYRFTNPEWFEQWTFYRPNDTLLRCVRALLPHTWSVRRGNIWYVVSPPKKQLPVQGWKIHVSASPANCEEILTKAAQVCIERATSFKFLLDDGILVRISHKGWSRESSGKFMALYPQDEQDFKELIEACYQALKGLAGPFVLTDRRYKDSGAVYYRYGGITGLSDLTHSGEQVPVLVDPEGRHVPDQRRPYWSPPDWVSDPFGVVEKEGDGRPLGGKYNVESALAFSATGGVYLARSQESGEQVVIKEARSLTGFDDRNTDAVARLRKEFRILQKLEATSIGPAPIEVFEEWEHTFLVEEYIQGPHLASFVVQQNPIIRLNPSQEARQSYLAKCKNLWTGMAEGFAAMHDAGVVAGDVSLTNILVSDTELGTIRFIDLEAAWEEGKDSAVHLTTPGFSAPRRRGTSATKEDDYYSLGSVMLATLFPMNSLLGLDPAAAERFLKELQSDLGVPATVMEIIRQCLSEDRAARPPPRKVAALLREMPVEVEPPRAQEKVDVDRAGLLAVARSAMDHALAIADYSRQDRLFPADPKVFGTNPLNVAYGASGVALALARIHGEVPAAVRSWILAKPMSPDSYPPGLYVGTSGVAWALWEMGVDDVARRVLREAGEHPLLWREANVFWGASGYGLACLRLYLGSKEQEWLDGAVKVGEWLLQQRRETEQLEYYWPDKEGHTWLGYPRGNSGIALFLLYLGLASGDDRFLTAGRRGLAFDLSHRKEVYGMLSIPRGIVGSFENVVTHYWTDGSAGVGLVLARYWKHTRDPDMLHILQRLAEDCSRKYAAFPGLFQGLSGLGNFLLDLHDFTGEERYLKEAQRTASGVLLYGIRRPTGIAFPGHDLLKHCTDMATGTAGVALFLHRLAMAEQKPGDFNLTLDVLLPSKP